MGRLAGYLTLGSVAYTLGYVLKGVVSFTWGPLVSGLFMGGLFIYWGLQSFQGRRVEVPLPRALGKTYQFLYRNLVKKAGTMKSVLIGLISIMLPCGLLYGLIIAALALGSYEDILVSLFFFWLGTLPAMIGAPQLIKKVMEPLRKKVPKAYAILFIVIGVMTIGNRLHQLPANDMSAHLNSEKSEHLCH